MAKIYNAVPGIGSGRGNLQVAVRSRLYQGPDHLLIVQSTGYTEDYKRIFYQDIRTIEVKHNNRQFWSAIIAGAIVVFFLLLYAWILPAIAAIILGAPFLIWLLVNLYRGATCDCYISTNVQRLKLPAPGRVNKVEVLINFLRSKAPAVELAGTGQPAA